MNRGQQCEVSQTCSCWEEAALPVTLGRKCLVRTDASILFSSEKKKKSKKFLCFSKLLLTARPPQSYHVRWLCCHGCLTSGNWQLEVQYDGKFSKCSAVNQACIFTHSGLNDSINKTKIQNDRQAWGTQTEKYLKGGHFASRSKHQQAVHKELYGLVQLSSEIWLYSAH